MLIHISDSTVIRVSIFVDAWCDMWVACISVVCKHLYTTHGNSCLFMQELELRHHGSAGNPADAAAITKAAAVADLSLLAGFLTQRGWANIPTGRGSSSGNDMGTQQELDEQLDEAS